MHQLVILDSKRRGEIMKEADDDAGHKGREATYTHISNRFWWPNIYRMVSRFVKTCYECQFCPTFLFIQHTSEPFFVNSTLTPSSSLQLAAIPVLSTLETTSVDE